MPIRKVVCYGELLWRLSPLDFSKPSESNVMELYPAGAEANVAVSLARWGVPVRYVTALPEHALAQAALQQLNSHGVDTSQVLRTGDRMGLYFLLQGNGLTTGQVVYDRKYSAFSQLSAGELHWEELFEGADWFHWSAITPALNAAAVAVLHEALIVARQKGLIISTDLNYRNRLWQYGKEPIEVMPDLVQYCDVVMGNIWAAHNLLGLPLPEQAGSTQEPDLLLAASQSSAAALFEKYPQCSQAAFTYRFSERPGHNLFFGTLHDRYQHRRSRIRETQQLVDRIGSGDAFMAGLIYGLAQQWQPQAVIEFASAAAFAKLFVKGDFNLTPFQEILKEAHTEV